MRSNFKRSIEENVFKVFDLLMEIGLWSFYEDEVILYLAKAEISIEIP